MCKIKLIYTGYERDDNDPESYYIIDEIFDDPSVAKRLATELVGESNNRYSGFAIINV